jgi:RNA polymerase sigma factor (TIGR02999 family)
MLVGMADVTQILNAIEAGDPTAGAALLPLVYDELRKLAAARIAEEKPGQTLQATALVHEAYIRLVGGEHVAHWNGRGHFFAAAAEAMRRILVEQARRKQSPKHGGGWVRIGLDQAETGADGADESPDRLLDLDRALARLRVVDLTAARLVELRYFAGLTMAQAAEVLGLPLRTTERNWTFARTWLYRELSDRPSPGG